MTTMEWLEGVRVVFGSVVIRQPASDEYIQLAVQSGLTMLAAVLGAAAAEYFHRKNAEKAEIERRKHLAFSILHKVSLASSALHSLLRSFFGRVPANTPSADLWRFVLPVVPLQDSLQEFSTEEFALLMPSDGNVDVGYSCAETINHTKICIAIVNYYSIERRKLADMLDQHTVDFDPINQEVENALNLNEHPNIRRKMLETGLLCEQLYNNLTAAIQNSNAAIVQLNNSISDRVGDPAFNRRIVVPPAA